MYIYIYIYIYIYYSINMIILFASLPKVPRAGFRMQGYLGQECTDASRIILIIIMKHIHLIVITSSNH